MVYGVVWEGVLECSNTLEDEDDPELLPQALVYKPCRQRIYGLLLLPGEDGGTLDLQDGTLRHIHTFVYTNRFFPLKASLLLIMVTPGMISSLKHESNPSALARFPNCVFRGFHSS